MTRITSTSIGLQSALYRKVPFRGLLLGAIVLAAAIGTGVGIVTADSTAVQQQPAPANNSSNESLTDTVIPNSSNVSAVNATANESESEDAARIQFSFPNQTINGTSVTVREPRLPDGGFLVVHGRSYPENGLGSVIGVSEYIAPNTSYSWVQIRLFDVAGRSFERAQLRAPSTMYVQAVLDTNGNQQYDALATTGAQDVSYLIDGSRPAVAGARIIVNQPVETVSQPGEFGDGFVSDQNQTTAPSASTNSSESGTATSGGGFALNPNQGSGFKLGSVPTSLGNFGPLLVLLAGLVVGIYIKRQ